MKTSSLNLTKWLVTGLLAIAVSPLIAVESQAQSYRYIDESGNIFFVDSIDQIPYRFRYQVIGTPTPVTIIEGVKGRKGQQYRNQQQGRYQRPNKPQRTPKPVKPKPQRQQKLPNEKKHLLPFSGSTSTPANQAPAQTPPAQQPPQQVPIQQPDIGQQSSANTKVDTPAQRRDNKNIPNAPTFNPPLPTVVNNLADTLN